jgi:predicted polyphosphate/ATP-dependent NAD kinase
MKKIGFIVNPIAGMGGAVGLKGTDGEEILRRAISLGAKPVAPMRARLFLTYLKRWSQDFHLLAAAGKMGEDEAIEAGIQCTPIGHPKEETGPSDTINSARLMMKKNVDLLVFCGGDGTARDIMDAVKLDLPVLGVPTGVKMHSAVFAVNLQAAARIAARFLSGGLPLREAEVMDVDEEAFREGRLSARLHGYMLVPYEADYLQTVKVSSPRKEGELRNQAAIAVYFIEEILQPNVVYILGPGTTTRTIADLLDQKKTLLGVDLLLNKKIIARDLNEKEILAHIEGREAKIVVTPIGGQGFIFGRGNQQISPKVIKRVGKQNIIVISTKSKLENIRFLRVDTGDPMLDQKLRGEIDVIIDYNEHVTLPVR